MPGHESSPLLPAPDPEAITSISKDTLVQVVNILDISTSLTVQIDRLEAERQRVQLPTDQDDVQSPDEHTSAKCAKYTIRDSRGNLLFLIFHTPPANLPQLGSFLTIKVGCELHRGILIGMPQTVNVLDKRGEIQNFDRIKYLRDLLSAS